MPLVLIPDNTKIKFVSKSKLCLTLSVLMILGTIALVVFRGINFGIDFTGGALIEIKTEQPAKLDSLRKGLGNVSIQTSGTANDVTIRIPLATNDSEEQAKIVNAAKENISAHAGSKVDFRRVDYVGPQVGSELISKAIYALLGAFAAIMLYVWARFEWQYGVGGLLALVHDAILVIGFYSITQIEFNLTSIAAILTVIGYSINDSVVIYDRVRENLRKYKKMPLPEMIDLTVNETLPRTIMTSFTTLFALIALILFGGDVLASFSWGAAFGIVVGTYSSIYVSALLLLVFKPNRNFENKKNPTNNNSKAEVEWVE